MTQFARSHAALLSAGSRFLHGTIKFRIAPRGKNLLRFIHATVFDTSLISARRSKDRTNVPSFFRYSVLFLSVSVYLSPSLSIHLCLPRPPPALSRLNCSVHSRNTVDGKRDSSQTHYVVTMSVDLSGNKAAYGEQIAGRHRVIPRVLTRIHASSDCIARYRELFVTIPT